MRMVSVFCTYVLCVWCLCGVGCVWGMGMCVEYTHADMPHMCVRDICVLDILCGVCVGGVYVCGNKFL